MNKWNIISLIISVASFLLPLVFGYKKRQTLLWAYLFIGFAFDISLIILKRIYHVNIFPFANLYVLIEFLLLSAYYYKNATKNNTNFLLITLIIACVYISQSIHNGTLNRNGTGASVLYVVYLLYALLGFYSISKKPVYANITTSSFFWVNVAILLGSSGRVILFLFEDYLIAHQNTYLGHLWIVYRLLNVLINILFAIALTRRYE